MAPTLLSIDCGTQSLRIHLFSSQGVLLDSVAVKYEPYVSPKPGWAEQDPELYWKSLIRACSELRNRLPNGFDSVAGVGVTSQRGTMINVDSNGKPLRPAIVWLDQRKASPGLNRKPLIDGLLALTGFKKKLDMIQSEGKCNWIIQNQPEVWKKTSKYLQVSGYLNYQLAGVFADSVASQIGHIPFSYRRRQWASSWELPAMLFPVSRDRLPDLVSPGERIGSVTPEAAKLTGIREGTPVIACGSDKGCETLGAGVIEPEMASLSFGTTATIQTTTATYIEPIPLMPPYPAPLPGHYNPEVEIFRGFWMITWFKKQFAHPEVEEAYLRNIAPEILLDRLLLETRPGAMGLIVQPFWGPGLGQPFAKGAMIGFGDVHTRAHIYRAVIEGLGYALKSGKDRIENKLKTPMKTIAVSGGASQSDAICQIVADIFNLPMVRGRTHETSGLGAAIVTATGTGIHKDFSEAVRNMVTVERRFDPDPHSVTLYRELYERVYQKMYKALEPCYRQIQKITGYPEL